MYLLMMASMGLEKMIPPKPPPAAAIPCAMERLLRNHVGRMTKQEPAAAAKPKDIIKPWNMMSCTTVLEMEASQ